MILSQNILIKLLVGIKACENTGNFYQALYACSLSTVFPWNSHSSSYSFTQHILRNILFSFTE